MNILKKSKEDIVFVRNEDSQSVSTPNTPPPSTTTTTTIPSPVTSISTPTSPINRSSEVETPIPKFKKEEVEESKVQSRRNHIVKEIITTEISYIQVLTVAVEEYQRPLRSTFSLYTIDGKTTMKSEHVDIIFSNIELILGFNKLLLLDIQKRFDSWNESTLIGDIFLRLTPFLKLYTEYSNNYNKSMELITLACKKSKPFKEFVEGRRKSSSTNELMVMLDSLLIAPVQRIPRYILLLRDLIKSTNSDHPDFKNLCASLALMQEVADHINNSMKTGENFNKLIEIENSIKGSNDKLAESHRLFVKEGHVVDILDKKKPLYLFLFNDILLLCKPEMMKKYSVITRLPLMQTFAFDVPETPTQIFWFKVQTPSKTWTFQTTIMNEKHEWIEAINAERDKQMEIEGAKILYRVLKKEEEKAMLEQLKSAASMNSPTTPSPSNKSHTDVNLSLLLQEKQKIQKLESKKGELLKNSVEVLRKDSTSSTGTPNSPSPVNSTLS